MAFHVAQVNVARMREPLGRPSMQAFVDGLEPINALADASPGFVWRLQTDDGDATSLRVFDDDMTIVNMSVWDSVEALREFVFRSEHAGYLRRRSEWFEKLAEASKKAVEDRFKKKVETEIALASTFYVAEDYHQDFYLKNATKYKFYRWNCGRDQRLEELWGKKTS